jgi:hypothetical protein
LSKEKNDRAEEYTVQLENLKIGKEGADKADKKRSFPAQRSREVSKSQKKTLTIIFRFRKNLHTGRLLKKVQVQGARNQEPILKGWD